MIVNIMLLAVNKILYKSTCHIINCQLLIIHKHYTISAIVCIPILRKIYNLAILYCNKMQFDDYCVQ